MTKEYKLYQHLEKCAGLERVKAEVEEELEEFKDPVTPLLKDYNLSMKELADKTGLSTHLLYKIQTGRGRTTSATNAKLYRVTMMFGRVPVTGRTSGAE